MGSFDSTCSISDVSIACGDEMVWQFLVPSWTRTYNKSKEYERGDEDDDRQNPNHEKLTLGDTDYLYLLYEKGLYVSNDGCTGMFSPFGFPLFGTYDDYGNISLHDDDKNKANIKLLEDFFQMDIEQIMEASSDDRWDRYSGDKSWSIKTWDDIEITKLKILRNMTNTHFARPVYDAIVNNTREGSDWFKPEERVNELCKILEEIEARGTKEEVELELEKLKTECEKDGMSEDAVEVIHEAMYRLKYPRRSGDLLQHKCMIPSLCDYNFYALVGVPSSHRESIMDLMCLQYGLSSAYKLLRPSYYGSQESNFTMIEHINRGSNEVIEKHKARQKAWDDEEASYEEDYESPSIDDGDEDTRI